MLPWSFSDFYFGYNLISDKSTFIPVFLNIADYFFNFCLLSHSAFFLARSAIFASLTDFQAWYFFNSIAYSAKALDLITTGFCLSNDS